MHVEDSQGDMMSLTAVTGQPDKYRVPDIDPARALHYCRGSAPLVARFYSEPLN